ncbi:MAG: Holliday junction resolvase RuvX [Clostridiales bacterium]|nr:Holliday junction resolvase RuvX [Candidatus Equinaster intestinalis]
MIIFAVDLGLVRTGLAASDFSENFAFPRGVITERNEEKLVKKVSEAAQKEKAELIVVGLPKNMDGSEGFRAKECTATAQKIAEESKIEVVMWDERCTTVQAHTALNFTDTRGKKRKETVDAVAAVMILESYLEYRKNKKN